MAGIEMNSGRNSSARQSKDAMGTGVLIILPVLNEVDNIGELLNRIEGELANRLHAVCIIDDGSQDGTIDIIKAAMAAEGHHLYLIQRQKSVRGSQRGSALKAGLEWGLQYTEHGVFVEMDGNLSHLPEELEEGLRLVETRPCDVAIASKYVPGSAVVRRPLTRRLVSLICSMAVSTVISRQIKDWSNGYRFYNRTAAQLLIEHQLKYASPIYLTEVMAIWLKRGMRIIEFPTLYVGRNEGLSKLRLIDLVKASLAVFEIGFRYHISDFAQFAKKAVVYPGAAYTARTSTSSPPVDKKP